MVRGTVRRFIWLLTADFQSYQGVTILDLNCQDPKPDKRWFICAVSTDSIYEHYTCEWGKKSVDIETEISWRGDPPAAISFSLELPGHPKLQVLVYLATSALGHFPLNGSTAKNALIPGNFQYLLRIVWYDRYKKIWKTGYKEYPCTKRIPFWGVELVNILANCRANVQWLKMLAGWHDGNYHLLPVFRRWRKLSCSVRDID